VRINTPLDISVEENFRRLLTHGVDWSRGISPVVSRPGGVAGEKFCLMNTPVDSAPTQLDVWVSVRASQVTEMFAAMGDAAGATRGVLTPHDNRTNIMLYMALHRDYLGLGRLPDSEQDPDVLLAKRLAKRLPRAGFSIKLERPSSLAWLNYWSPATCEVLQFPDPGRDADLLKHSFQTPNGAWLFKLTEEPLDLHREDHQDALVRAYARFPELESVKARRKREQAVKGKRRAR
jgi:hypothetical protein